jgi:hypothetical protein
MQCVKIAVVRSNVDVKADTTVTERRVMMKTNAALVLRRVHRKHRVETRLGRLSASATTALLVMAPGALIRMSVSMTRSSVN